MKICFVGLGSIGKRHLRNISALLTSRGESPTIDALRSSNKPLSEDVASLLHRQYQNADDMPTDYDVAFICSPTALHYRDICYMAAHARNMFIEKPLFDKPEEIDSMGLKDGSMYYVACPLRYNAVLQYIKEYIVGQQIYAARAICSTYLPDWRPGTDYRTTYSANRGLGGGVGIDLIHEWDYLTWLFGMPKRVETVCGRYSALELDSDDLALYIGTYEDRLISLHLDYFGRSERREIELYTKDDTIVGDIRNGQVHFLREGRTIDLSEPRDAYQRRELVHFLDIMAGVIPNDSDMVHAQNVLKIAKGEWAE